MGNNASDCIVDFTWNAAPQLNVALQLQNAIMGYQGFAGCKWHVGYPLGTSAIFHQKIESLQLFWCLS